MVEYDMRRIRKLQRDIDDLKRTRMWYRLLISFAVFMVVMPVLLIIVGAVFDISLPQQFAFGMFGLDALGLIMSPILFVENECTPFQDVRDAERDLEDYYDTVGMA